MNPCFLKTKSKPSKFFLYEWKCLYIYYHLISSFIYHHFTSYTLNFFFMILFLLFLLLSNILLMSTSQNINTPSGPRSNSTASVLIYTCPITSSSKLDVISCYIKSTCHYFYYLLEYIMCMMHICICLIPHAYLPCFFLFPSRYSLGHDSYCVMFTKWMRYRWMLMT